jgi:hypothetical protein
MTILANCVFLAIDDPNKEELSYQVVSDFIFLVIFTVEMLLKIIAMGFLLKPFSYLRDAWNIVRYWSLIFSWILSWLLWDGSVR